MELKYLIFDDFPLNLDVFYLVNMLLAWLTILNSETVMTSGPYHYKRLKKWRGDQVILHLGINSLFIVEHSGKEIEVSGKTKTDANRFYGNTV